MRDAKIALGMGLAAMAASTAREDRDVTFDDDGVARIEIIPYDPIGELLDDKRFTGLRDLPRHSKSKPGKTYNITPGFAHSSTREQERRRRQMAKAAARRALGDA